MTASTLVIIPTYNEAENIEALVKAVQKEPLRSPPDILVVDDGSPDGTGAVIDRLCAGRPHLFALHRAKVASDEAKNAPPFKRGLGPAYLAGFRWGLTRGYRWLIQMDADFSHDPSYLAVIEQLIQGASGDVFIGSRYRPGGGVVNWSWRRRLLSRGGNLLARQLLRLPLSDLTGGFNAWRAEALQAIALDQILSNGYAFQIELKRAAVQKGYRCVEFPILFTERRTGASKMSGAIVWEAVRFLFKW